MSKQNMKLDSDFKLNNSPTWQVRESQSIISQPDFVQSINGYGEDYRGDLEEDEIKIYDREDMTGVLGPSYQDIVQSYTQAKSRGDTGMARAADRDYREFLTKYEYDVREEEKQKSFNEKVQGRTSSPLLATSPGSVSRLETSRELLRTLLYLLLVVGEAVAWLRLYSGLEDSQHEVILYLLCAPSLVTSLCWLSSSFRRRVSCSSTISVVGLLLLSLPSPVLL